MTAALLRDDHVLLLRAALLEGDAAADAFAHWRRAVAFDAIDGNALRLVPLLYRNLQGLGCADSIMGRMKGIWRRSWVENRMRINACAPAVAELAQAGIPTVLLKGAAMIARWVDDVGVRPMADFDVLVPRAQARTAIAVLIAAGWTPYLWRADRFDDADFDAWHGTAFRKHGYEIDLHWRALRDGASASGNDGFWARAIPAQLGDAPTRVLAPEDHLFHACIHGANWAAGGRIDWAADAILILRAAGSGFDWPRVAALARAQHLTAPLEALLATLRDAVDAAVPRRLGRRRAMRPSALVERLEFRLRRRPPHCVGDLGHALLALQDFRRRSARWIDRPLVAALPAFGRERWQLDRSSRVPGFAAFVGLGRPPALRRLLAGDVRPRLLARRDLPDLATPRLALGDEAAVRGALVLGWSVPESGGGRWTDGSEALIALRAAGQPPGDLPIALRLRPFAHPRHPPIAVEVWANDRPAASWRFAHRDGALQTRGLVVDGALLARRPVLSLGLRVHGAGSPAALGLSDDMRRLGLFVEELRLALALPPDALARPLALREGSPDTAVLWDGWSTPESDGCWTCAPRSVIRLRLSEPAPRGLAVELHGRAYVSAQRRALSIAVGTGGAPLLRRRYGPHDCHEPLRFTVPAGAIASGVLAIALDIADPIAPAASGDSPDPRLIGLYLQHLVLRAL